MIIPKIVLTGGPCAGKTTAMTYICQRLSELGYYPFIVPEAATLLMSGKATPEGCVTSPQLFQRLVMETMMQMEAHFEAAAREMTHLKPVILCDRGIMDNRAYMTETEFAEVAQSLGLDLRTMRDERYHGILHLRSAAIGAEEFYTTANNAVRKETLEEARALDERTLLSWLGHPHLAVIDNEGKSFEQKLQLLFRKLCRVIGEPEPLEIERKYLVGPVDLEALGVTSVEIDIEQYYLQSPLKGEQLRIRRRGQLGAHTYFETKKKKLRPGVRIETERFITEKDYVELSRNIEPGTVPLCKRRRCFVWNHQHFELDVFDSSHIKGLTLLEIELTSECDKVDLPPFIHVIKDVTNDRSFTNHALSRIST